MEVHEPVMVNEVVRALHIKNSARVIDATLGAGGHAEAILKQGGEILGIDWDERMLNLARKRLEKYGERFRGYKVNFRELEEIAREEGFKGAGGVVFDLGISSVHLDRDERGFSFKNKEVPLDMRLDPETQGVRAADLLNSLREDQLREMFGVVMAKSEAKRLAEKVVMRRGEREFKKVGDLVEICGQRGVKKIHPATKAFLALRMAVNTELDNLSEGLEAALKILGDGGRIVVISFHSGEDGIVKKKFLDWERRGLGEAVGKGPMEPSEEEIEKNPRARSAKLRVFEKNEKKRSKK